MDVYSYIVKSYCIMNDKSTAVILWHFLCATLVGRSHLPCPFNYISKEEY